MFSPTMATWLSSSHTRSRHWWTAAAGACLAAALGVVASGCGRAAERGPRPVLLYCTSAVEAQAKVLKQVLESGGFRQVVLAPLTGADMVTALEGLQAGDLAVVAGTPMYERLAERKLTRGEPVTHPLAVCAVAVRTLELADLGKPGMRLGNGAKDGDRAAAVERALPPELRPLVAANTRQRSERGDELVRLLRLGALDAALVWDTPPPAADLQRLPLPEDPSPCPLLIVALSCSRLSPAASAALLTELRGDAVPRALRGERGGTQEATAP